MTTTLVIAYVVIVTYVTVSYFDRKFGVGNSVVEDLSEG